MKNGSLSSHSSHCGAINLQCGAFKSHKTTLMAKKVDVCSHISCSYYPHVNVLFHSNQRTKLTKSCERSHTRYPGSFSSIETVLKNVECSWADSLISLSVQAQEGEPLITLSPSISSSSLSPLRGLVSRPTQLTQEPPVDRNSWWWFALYTRSGSTADTHSTLVI